MLLSTNKQFIGYLGRRKKEYFGQSSIKRAINLKEEQELFLTIHNLLPEQKLDKKL